MGISNFENQNKEQIIIQLRKEMNNLQNLIRKYINDSYCKTTLDDLKKEIINYIEEAFQKKILDIEKLLNSKVTNTISKEENQYELNNRSKQKEVIYPKKDVIIKYDYFIRKDIQMKNLVIATDFEENKYSNYINDDKIENKSIAYFLVANLSRLAFNESNKFLELVYQEYNNEKKKKLTIKQLQFLP